MKILMDSVRQFFLRLHRLWLLSAEYDENRERDRTAVLGQLDKAQQEIKRHTIVHADIHWAGRPHQVIVIGRYQNRDYVRVFDVEADNWVGLVERLKREEEGARVGRFDVPHVMPFSAVYPHDKF